MIKKKLIFILIFFLSIVTLTSCDLNFSLDFLFPDDENEELETAKTNFINKFNNGINVTIDNKKMTYSDAYNYICSTYNNKSYDSKMNELMEQLNTVSNEFFELYSEYLTLTNEEIEAQNTDFYSYKSKLLNSYISDSIINDIVDLVEDLNNDSELTTLIKPLKIDSVKSLELTNYVADKSLSFNSKTNDELESYLTTFVENYTSMSFFNEENIDNINTFLTNSNNIVIEDSDTINYEGYTSFNNNVANKITIKNNTDVIKLLGTLTHEIGHVADSSLAKLEDDETYACITEALSYYFCDSFDYNSNINNIANYYKQRILYDTINSFYGWVGYLVFIQNIYTTNNTITSDTVLDIMDNVYHSNAASLPAKYEMLWKIDWIVYAYYDVSNSGSFVYTYGALNAAYLWNLYKTDSATTIKNFQYLQKYEGNFSSYSDFGLIGEDNISDTYTSLKNLIIANVNLFIDLNNIAA